jgi:putative ABC transport system substrate-binding protein
LAAKKAVEGTDIPVIASPMGSGNPVEEGIVESLTQPGGNVTGVCCGNFMPKALDWLFTLMPGTTMMYVPYYPDSRSSAPTLAQLPEVAASLGVELVLDEVSSPEEEVATIKALPDDAVVYIVPRVDDVSHIVQAATERGLAVGAVNDERALVNLISDLGAMSKQAARLADQILQGTAPADLPVERAEAFLRINLKTAEAMGLDVPDEILQQADTIIR